MGGKGLNGDIWFFDDVKYVFVYATYLSFLLHRLMFKFLFKEREAAKRMFSGKRGQDNDSKAKKAKTWV